MKLPPGNRYWPAVDIRFGPGRSYVAGAARDFRGQHLACCYGVHVLGQEDRIMDRRELARQASKERLGRQAYCFFD